MKDNELWERIASCHPDDVEASFPFSSRLARENGWPLEFADHVIGEYLKFAYLSRLDAGSVTPSDEVDQAWHLHLTYTQHYWGPFKDALGAPLHHMPTKGGGNQAAYFHATYEKTLNLYRQEFGEPPADIWPPASIRFARAPHFKRINTQEVWLVPKLSLRLLSDRILRPFKVTRFSARTAGLLAFASLAGAGAALAHTEPQGDTFIEQFRNMMNHWAEEHTGVFVLGAVGVFAVIVAIRKSAFGKSGSDSGSGCGSGGNDGGASGCAGCGGGD
ncbi:hypothetical protein [Labrenzia sp. CE80]|uniref:glycine-rich domain-containing protein n=1 Tax=Labrenzia sp. CE80 TaxID=1788986 RepID=UPI00129B5835|nr:hypothetical protein [Labrenzia sp. CE80]